MNALTLPFEKGVLGVLHGHWELKLITPLVIRAGSEDKAKSAFKQQDRNFKKGRGGKDIMAFAWKDARERIETTKRENTKEWSEVTDFNYHFSVNKDGKLEVKYNIPASSIRGSLRQWAIKSWIERSKRDFFSLPKKNGITKEDIQQKFDTAKGEIENLKGEWHQILSLFGCAFDIDPKGIDHPLTWAGRMRIHTEIISNSDSTIEACGEKIIKVDGPKNIKRHINVRNPIDRVTMAARDKGLHYGLEMSEGEKFEVNFHILNPEPTDIELIELWTQDIEGGYLRFGGLTSQGRGRVDFDKKGENASEEPSELYQLFVSTRSPFKDKLKDFSRSAKIDDLLFDNFWHSVELTRSELIDFFKTTNED